ncbi:CLIP domain-containing serine protease 2-like [Belonocnema kinseyi]|uniref:CLIP domain-containing serine protease 2-like n=1 Tax=Belonocnema kinseyi TaxID=2817044 RepID=UPI00143D847F|nr:CLIP domain-containing serine protease 2-like [Belonocnema kinseyi]XP_033226884.1 CLIP domain-containing serine protease 2-like [Belonocnema kinseyi]
MNFPSWLCSIFVWTFIFEVELSTESVLADVMAHPNWKLLDRETCGTSNSDRIIGGKNASLGAYPWIAQIGYITDSNPKLIYRCGATLISKFYVITAAHCVAELPATLTVVRVRLGEHNSDTNPDCENGYCAEPVQDFKPENIIAHKDYNKTPFKDDIAIIRLNEPVVFNGKRK